MFDVPAQKVVWPSLAILCRPDISNWSEDCQHCKSMQEVDRRDVREIKEGGNQVCKAKMFPQ